MLHEERDQGETSDSTVGGDGTRLMGEECASVCVFCVSVCLQERACTARACLQSVCFTDRPSWKLIRKMEKQIQLE